MQVEIVEPASLGSVSIRKGECGVEELHVMFFGWRRYTLVILFVVGLVWVALGSASAVHGAKNQLRDGDEARWG